MIEGVSGVLNPWSLPKTDYMAQFTEAAAASTSDKHLIGSAHFLAYKGAGRPRRKDQTERLIGPRIPENGHPACAVHRIIQSTCTCH
jgi:hypothetical protein